MVTMLSNEWEGGVTKAITYTLPSPTGAGLHDDTELFFTPTLNHCYEIEIHLLFNATLVSGSAPQIIVGFGESSDATKGFIYPVVGAGAMEANGFDDRSDNFFFQAIVYDTDYSLVPAITPLMFKGAHFGLGGTWNVRWGTRASKNDNYHLLAGSTLRWRTIYPAT